jgi:hypothetical protein
LVFSLLLWTSLLFAQRNYVGTKKALFGGLVLYNGDGFFLIFWDPKVRGAVIILLLGILHQNVVFALARSSSVTVSKPSQVRHACMHTRPGEITEFFGCSSYRSQQNIILDDDGASNRLG